MSDAGYVGVDPEYQNAANPLDRPLGDPSPEALRVLENEELCRQVPAKLDWKGNPLDQEPVAEPVVEVEPEPEPEPPVEPAVEPQAEPEPEAEAQPSDLPVEGEESP